MIFALIALAVLGVGYLAYVKFIKKPVAAATAPFQPPAPSSTQPTSIPPAAVSVVQPSQEKAVSNSDPRSTADIVAECNSLAPKIHDLQVKIAAGDGSGGPQLTEDSQQLDHDVRELAKRHAAGDASAVWKNPFAR